VILAAVVDLRYPPLPICPHAIEARCWTRLRLLGASAQSICKYLNLCCCLPPPLP
jgi:hypothetical protein